MGSKTTHEIPVVGLFNHKGGVGKTTTAHNLAFGLANAGYKVLLLDLDSQASLSIACNSLPKDNELSLGDVAVGSSFLDAIRPLRDNLHFVPAHPTLSGFDLHFASTSRREYILWKILKPYIIEGQNEYDVVLMDCPPAKNLLSQNGFVCMTHILIPIQMQYFSMAGLELLTKTVTEWGENELLRPNFQILGYLATFYSKQLSLTEAVFTKISEAFGDLVFTSKIRTNTHLAEAPSHYQDIFSYMPNCPGAVDYGALVLEVIERLNLKRRK